MARQRELLQISCQHHQIKLTESLLKHIGNLKTGSFVKQEEHEAPHIKEEDLVETTVPGGESENSLDSVRDLTTQRLTAAAGEIFTEFERTILQYKEEVERQRRLLEIISNPQIRLHRTELPQHHDCTEEQLLKLEINYCLQQEESEPPQIKEEREEPELLQVKEEQEELGLLQPKEDQEERKLYSLRSTRNLIPTRRESGSY
ncbi:uncharacterized protein LOC115382828 isoform X2 [Salarias fasciatus]|uniref:uncharacterized protein LOC115382828 isoform X2 n=1 Tax=Salarias fasciatus TaxID=181472 RepID=UPI0011770977|nr:uncharacterized protein LOC115382828 isoform X2 [Salarias fasciatus]